VIRIAAVGDVHVGPDCAGCLELSRVNESADLLLLAGDLTRIGDVAEARVLADELHDVRVPIVAVLGNHDFHSNRADEITACMTDAGATVLEGASTIVEVAGTTVGIAGTKGFGGGFSGAHGSNFGEPEMKAFVRHTQRLSERLEQSLRDLTTTIKVALLHYSPIEATLAGERLEIYPFLGSYLLAEAVDSAGADLVVHGHAHHGSERGATPGGAQVRNVAKPVIGAPFKVYTLDEEPAASPAPSAQSASVAAHSSY
jgi:Icc-related predicted phosphoesterase